MNMHKRLRLTPLDRVGKGPRLNLEITRHVGIYYSLVGRIIKRWRKDDSRFNPFAVPQQFWFICHL